ncbi:MAG: FHA domain-containing protein [Bacteroides sp.]|nr:FHA domain-containing protein [Bacteroides sp.]MCM1550433.1 FHA domain-containing protein [Clostridium sp.]
MQILGVAESKGRNYIAYTFENPHVFYEVGYKGLRASQNVDFVSCNYMTYNGRIRLLYHIAPYCSLATAVTAMSPNAFANLLVNMFDAILEIRNSSFINIETVELDPQKVFVDREKLKLYFIYVPVNVQSSPEHYYTILDYVKKSILYLIRTNENLRSDLISRIERELTDSGNSMDNLRSNISELLGIYRETGNNPYREILYSDKRTTSEFVPEQRKENEKTDKRKPWFKHDKKKEETSFAETSVLLEEFVPQIALIHSDSQSSVELLIDKREYIIGHQSGSADGCIDTNAGISRRHCRICNINGKNYIVDLTSTNGTFVNGKRITPEQNIEITPGDKVRLADMEFLVANGTGR